jgi:hypothetical protein
MEYQPVSRLTPSIMFGVPAVTAGSSEPCHSHADLSHSSTSLQDRQSWNTVAGASRFFLIKVCEVRRQSAIKSGTLRINPRGFSSIFSLQAAVSASSSRNH